jgi:hypothetical protein
VQFNDFQESQNALNYALSSRKIHETSKNL